MTQRGVQRTEQRGPMRIRIRRASNRFDVDPSKIPDGMSYEWKAQTVLGQEDREGMLTAEMNYWRPVPAERHPEIVGADRARAGSSIVVGGQILMERAKEITEESRRFEMVEAAQQYAGQLEKLRLDGHRAAGKGLRRSYEAIPDDE